MSAMTLFAIVILAGWAWGFTMMPRALAPETKVLDTPWMRFPETVTPFVFGLITMPAIDWPPVALTEFVMLVIVLFVIEPPVTELLKTIPAALVALAERFRMTLPDTVGPVAN